MNEKMEELGIIVEMLHEWAIKCDEEKLHLYVTPNYTNVFNDPKLPEERRFDIIHFYEPDGGETDG